MAHADEAQVVSVTPATGRDAQDSLLNRFGPHLQTPPGHLAEDDGGSAPERMVSQAVKEEPLDEPQEISGDEGEIKKQDDTDMKSAEEVKDDSDHQDGEKEDTIMKSKEEMKDDSDLDDEEKVKSESDSEDEEKVDADMKEEEEEKVKSESDLEDKVKGEPGVKLEAKVKGEPKIKGEPGIKLEAKVKGEPGIKLEAKVKGEPGIKLEAKVKGEPGIKLEAKVKDELGIKLEAKVKEESEEDAEAKALEEALEKARKEPYSLDTAYDSKGRARPLAAWFDEHDFFKYGGKLPPGVGPRRIRRKRKPIRYRILDDDELGEAEIIESRSTPVVPRTEAEGEDHAEAKVKIEPGVKAEPGIKLEAKVKTEPGVKVEPGIKQEAKVKNELGVKVEPGIKLEPKVKSEPGIKAEPGIKVEPGTGVKRELQEDEDGETASPKRRRIRVKTEPGVSSASGSVPAVPSLPPTAPGKLPGFRERLPGWIKDCLVFQKTKRTWAPTRPCCPANCFFEDVAPPPKPAKGGKYTSCFHRLTPAQQVSFRHFYEQNKENLYCSFLFAEKKEAPEKPKRKPYLQPEPEPDGKVYRAFEMMKMWPWSRDLPSFIWKPGHFIKDGIAHKVDHCGEKVPFTKVWESRGTGPPDKEAKAEGGTETASERKGTGFTAAAQEGAASRSSSQGTMKKIVKRQSKKSGETGINWNAHCGGWSMEVRRIVENKRYQKAFPINRYISEGYSERDAEERALADAKAHKKDLVRRGIIKDTRDSLSKGGGVLWDQKKKLWLARLQYRDSENKKREHGRKTFTPEGSSREQVDQARQQAEAFVQHLRVKHQQVQVTKVKSMSEVVHHKSNIPGISWVPSEGCWRAQFSLVVCGKQKQINFRPKMKHESQEEVDRTFQEAAAWMEEQTSKKAALEKLYNEKYAEKRESKVQLKK